MHHHLARLAVVAVIMASSVAVQPGRAQPLPGTNVFLPNISNPPVIEITDAVRFASCKGMCPGVHGHVRNNSASPVYAVVLQADFFDQAGQARTSATFAPALPVLFPGESSPFEVFPGWYPPIYDFTYELHVVGYSVTSAMEYRPVTVVTKHVDWRSYEIGHVTGTVRNDHVEDLHTVEVIVSDSEGNYARVATFDALRRGATMPYASSYLGWYAKAQDESTVTVQAIGRLRR